MAFAACASAAVLHCSPVVHKTFQAGLSGAAMSFCNWGLTSVGTGMVFAGTWRGASVPSSASAAPETEAKAAHASRRNLVSFIVELSPVLA